MTAFSFFDVPNTSIPIDLKPYNTISSISLHGPLLPSHHIYEVSRSFSGMSDNAILEQAWALVENLFDLQELFGEVGSLFLEEEAAKKCLHTMAISMSVLAGLAPLGNGAQVRIWSEPTPLVLATLLINPPQSRTSQTTSLLRELGTVIDQTCHERERACVLQRHPAVEEDIVTETPPLNVLEGFTPEAGESVTQSLTATSTDTLLYLNPQISNYVMLINPNQLIIKHQTSQFHHSRW